MEKREKERQKERKKERKKEKKRVSPVLGPALVQPVQRSSSGGCTLRTHSPFFYSVLVDGLDMRSPIPGVLWNRSVSFAGGGGSLRSCLSFSAGMTT